MWMQIQEVDNSTFEDEYDIDKGRTDWTRKYNKNMVKQSYIFYRKELCMCLYIREQSPFSTIFNILTYSFVHFNPKHKNVKITIS